MIDISWMAPNSYLNDGKTNNQGATKKAFYFRVIHLLGIQRATAKLPWPKGLIDAEASTGRGRWIAF
jgi:hypothetical protein